MSILAKSTTKDTVHNVDKASIFIVVMVGNKTLTTGLQHRKTVQVFDAEVLLRRYVSKYKHDVSCQSSSKIKTQLGNMSFKYLVT